jgi:hypothetical protein
MAAWTSTAQHPAWRVGGAKSLRRNFLRRLPSAGVMQAEAQRWRPSCGARNRTLAGHGLFWGIENSWRKSPQLVRTHGGEPKAAFSTMKSKPWRGRCPNAVVLTAYVDETGVTSAARSRPRVVVPRQQWS